MKETLCRSPPGAAIVGGRHVNTTIDHWVTLYGAITDSHVGWFLPTSYASPTGRRKRRKVEALFSELKNLIGLRRLRLRRIKFVREQFYLAAVAQNLKRLVRFLNMRAQPAMATA